MNIDRQQTVSNEAQHYTLGEIQSCLRSIERAAQQIEQNVNPTLAMEVLLLSMPRPQDGGAEPRTRPAESDSGAHTLLRSSQV